MAKKEQPVAPTMSGPAVYRIRVRGPLEPKWLDRLGQFEVVQDTQPDGSIVTSLTGRFQDQAALSGILNAVYSLHLPVLSVDCLDANTKQDS